MDSGTDHIALTASQRNAGPLTRAPSCEVPCILATTAKTQRKIEIFRFKSHLNLFGVVAPPSLLPPPPPPPPPSRWPCGFRLFSVSARLTTRLMRPACAPVLFGAYYFDMSLTMYVLHTRARDWSAEDYRRGACYMPAEQQQLRRRRSPVVNNTLVTNCSGFVNKNRQLTILRTFLMKS